MKVAMERERERERGRNEFDRANFLKMTLPCLSVSPRATKKRAKKESENPNSMEA